ncbi:VWA domain-containing protein [bacterium]|nr:VWA domain-containing protein [bacterium]
MTMSSRSQSIPSLFSFYCSAAYLTLVMTAAMLATSYSFAQASVSVESNADIRVLIDVSGSMKQNDPRNLRRPALDLLVQLFPSDSRAGVWTFGKYVNMLVPHDTVSTRWRDQSANKSRLINSEALHTHIGLALEKAIYDQERKKYSDTQDFKTSVILLTDGVVDIDKDPIINQRERQRILETLLPQYQAAGIAIHAVALSSNADVELLERLAIETDGIFAVAEDAEDLNRIFLRAFDQSSPSDRAPLDDNRFLIDSSVEEFTALVFRKPGSAATQIKSPSGQIFNADFDGASLRWFASDAYDLMTIQQPEEGEWTINADIDPDNRVTVVSDLTLAIAPIANNLYHGETATLTASILESGEVVSRDEFLDLFTVDASMSRSNTAFWRQTLVRNSQYKKDSDDKSDSLGIYSRELDMLRNSGDYALTVSVDGKTFKREKTLKFTVREPFRVELAANELEGEFALTVIADDKRLRTADVVLTAVINLPNGSEQVLELASDKLGVWRYEAAEQSTGSYTINLTASGRNSESRVVDYTLDEQALYLNVPGIPEPIVLPEPELNPDLNKEPVEKADAPIETSIEAAEEAKEKNSWLPYVLLIGGNLLLIGLLFFIYKKMMSGGSSSSDSSSSKQVAPKKAIDNADAESNSPPLIEDEYQEVDKKERSEKETVGNESEIDDKSETDSVEDVVEEDVEAGVEKIINADNSKEDTPVDINAVDVSVDEAASDAATEIKPESITDGGNPNSKENRKENDKTNDANLGALLDIDAEQDVDNELDAKDDLNAQDVDKEEANTSDDIDIEFDLSADDDLPENKK